MNPYQFPEANRRYGPPEGMAESQVMTIHAFAGVVADGSIDGSPIVVTAWQPTPEEIALIQAGAPIFLTFMGGLPPHFPSLNFQEATHPA